MVRYPAHVDARLVVVERVTLKLLGRQARLLAPVHSGHVLEYRVDRLQQFAGDFCKIAHFRLFDHAVRLHVVHNVGRPVADRRAPGNREPVHVVQVTVTGLLVVVNRPVTIPTPRRRF